MKTYSKDEFDVVATLETRQAELTKYITHPGTLKKRIEVALSAFKDALYIWNKIVAKPYFLGASQINQDKLTKCRVFNHRFELLKSLPSVKNSLEIGVFEGAFSREIAKSLHSRHHTMVDVRAHLIDRQLFEDLPTEISIISGRSSEVLPDLPAHSLEFIYIDGGHDEVTVKQDLVDSRRLISAGGIIMLNDYCNWSMNEGVRYGVMSATNEFLNEADFEMIGIAIDGSGSFDVALKQRF